MGPYCIPSGVDFYPRSPRGERLRPTVKSMSCATFLSTLPARGATKTIVDTLYNGVFLSTLPARGATDGYSIQLLEHRDFYPRSPRGERRRLRYSSFSCYRFLSTLPARGATTSHLPCLPQRDSFLSTLPARGATREQHSVHIAKGFLSTLPARGATTRSGRAKR